MTNIYLPEGALINSFENRSAMSSVQSLEKSAQQGKILEGIAGMCDGDMCLHVDLCGIEGIIRKEECVLAKAGEEIKDIAVITRVGKPVCFKVIGFENIDGVQRAVLSRRLAQVECLNYYLSSLIPGDIIPACVTHLENFGAFVDIGCGIVSLLSIDCISVSRISHPSDRLSVGMKISVAVKSNDPESGRIYVTQKELLGTWEENAASFSVGQTISGIVRSVESYGVFIELAPNLAGLAELKDGDGNTRNLKIGQSAAVFIKSIIPERMKIKLVIIDSYQNTFPVPPVKYYIDTEKITHIDSWQYSPVSCNKIIKTVFEE